MEVAQAWLIFLCPCRSSTSRDELGEEDPVGWFEMEEEWDEVEIKMQQCRISKVKLLFYTFRLEDSKTFTM